MPTPAEHRVRLSRQALLVGAQLQRRLEAALGVTPRHDSPRACGDPLIIERQVPLLAHSIDELGQIRDPILPGARRAALELYRGARLQPSWPRESSHQADQNAAAKVASSGPEPSERDRTTPVPGPLRGTCQSDRAQPRTRGGSEHTPGNKALRGMRPILHPRAACVVGHRAKDQLATASGCRQARATASLAPTPSQRGQFRPSFSPGPQPTGSLMSGSALRQRSNPTRWASGSGPGGECFARGRSGFKRAVDDLETSAFRVRAPLGRPSL